MKNIYTEGFLYDTFKQVVYQNKKIEFFTTTDLAEITRIYGELYKKGNLYDLLFVDSPQSIKLKNGWRIHTKDIAAFTLMRYMVRAKTYWKPKGGRIYADPSYGIGTPLALLGARNDHNVPYMRWTRGIDINDLDSVYKLDVFLGFELASTVLDPITNELSWNPGGDGLIKFLNLDDSLFGFKSIRQLRESMRSITDHTTKELDIDIPNIQFYNDATIPMRHLLRQTWCWHSKWRNSNMILDYMDWDYVPKDVDKLSSSILGHVPEGKVIPSGILSRLGMKEEMKEPLPDRINSGELKI